MSDIIHVARTGNSLELGIIPRTGVGIVKFYREWASGGLSLLKSFRDIGLIGFDAGCSTLCTRLAACYVSLKISFTQRQSRRYSLHFHAHNRVVGASVNLYSEIVSETVVHMTESSKSSTKVGKDLATQDRSSISTGESAPSDATLRAITILWS